jgi:cholesterol oxidase
LTFVPHSPRLSSPGQNLAYRYDVVVVGSGYGGSILAARLAEAGKKVCILERGREWLPGDFPTDETAVAAAIRTPFSPLGLLDPNTQVGNDIDVVVGSGLGGTSLINAGISLRPERDVFEQSEWPSAIRNDYKSGILDSYFERAEKMLGAARHHEPLSALAKVKAHCETISARGIMHATLPLNVNRERGVHFGIDRPACTSCGDCVSGCNVGAKNTLTTNYLPLAKHHGARIFTGKEVKRIEPDVSHDGRVQGYIVEFHEVGPKGIAKQTRTVRGSVVILSAGSMGSTEILLRSQSKELPLSKRVGERFSANADILGFSYNGRYRTDVIGYGNIGAEREGWPVGTTISSYGDYRASKKPLEERFLLLEGAIPTSLASFVARAIAAYSMLTPFSFSAEQRVRIRKDIDLRHCAPGPDGALNHSMLFLACGHDSGNGRLVLKDRRDGRVHVNWPGVGKEPCFAIITEEMQALAREHGGYFLPNPRSAIIGGRRQMTVHPLGGCPMGEDAEHGAVDHRGGVFNGDTGEVHAGLYVADGAIVPRSLGVTPLLTISALSERIASLLIKEIRSGA